MIITLSGITGVGKSYYKNYIVQNFGIENIVIYTTRPKRTNEIDGIDKNFVTIEEMEARRKNGSLFATYEFLGEMYGYDKKYLNDSIHSATELHYEWVLDFKQKAKDVFAIYMIPKDIEIAKKELQKRKLPQEIYNMRIREIEEHQKKIKENNELYNAFDAIFYNDYTLASNQKMMQLVQNKLNERKC